MWDYWHHSLVLCTLWLFFDFNVFSALFLWFHKEYMIFYVIYLRNECLRTNRINTNQIRWMCTSRIASRPHFIKSTYRKRSRKSLPIRSECLFEKMRNHLCLPLFHDHFFVFECACDFIQMVSLIFFLAAFWWVVAC